MADTPKSKEQEEDALVKEIKTDIDYDFRAWEPVYKEADTDAKYIAGDPWESKDLQSRKDAGRPALVFDELGQYINTAINDVRANPVAGEFAPEGDGANDETARFYEGLAREIDYQSNAKIADTTAFENCLQRSLGFERIYAEFEHPLSFKQRLRVGAVPNPNAVVPDADGMRPDGSDWRRLSYIEKYSREEFKREFPNAQFKDYSREQVNIGNAWGSENHVQVVEFWRLKMVEKAICEYEVPGTLQNPEPQIKSLIKNEQRPQPGWTFIQERVSEIPEVTSCYTNGLEILEKRGKKIHKWAGDSIPFASCYGKILWLNEDGMGAKRTILSMTRLARSPYMAYCFAVTSLIEAIGTITKNPYTAYEGQLTVEHMNLIAKSMHEPVAVLLAKPFIDSMPGTLLPLPQRNPMSIDLTNYLQATEICRQAIRSAMGLGYLPTPAQRNNEKSGVALDRIKESGQQGSYHFKDSYYMMLRRRLEIEENLIDRLYDTPRDVNIRLQDDTSETWTINDPRKQGKKTLPSIKGRHSVTIKIGPASDSQRDQADKFVTNFVTSPQMQMIEPPKRDKLIALGIRSLNIGPMGDKMADVISPPEQEQGTVPKQQLDQVIQQAQAAIAQLQKELTDAKSGIEAKQLELQTKALLAEKADATKREITATQESGDTLRTQMQIDADKEITALKLAGERAKVVSSERQHDQDMAHDAVKTLVGHQHAINTQTQAEDAQEQAAERGHEQALESAEHTASLQPEEPNDTE